jgi:hypothetical protein
MAAQEMILKLLFNDDGTFAGLEEINKELKKVDDSTTEVEKSTKNLKQQYAELRREQDKYDPGTEKFNELSVKMGELKDRMNDAADAVKGNTGPAVEGLRNSFGLMGEQLSNLDFEGLSQSLNLVTNNIKRIDTKALGDGLKAAFNAGVAGVKALGKAVLANPILLLVAAILSVIVYWKELSDLVTGQGKMKAELEGQVTAYENQAKQLERINNLAKIQSKDAGQILKSELFILEVKKQQALAAYRLALLEGDAAKISEQRNALDDANMAIMLRREQSAKSINDYYNNALQSSEQQLNSDADKQRINDEINSKMSEAMSLQISLTQEIQKQQLLLEQQRKMPNILGDPRATEQEIRRLTDERKGYTKQIFYLDEEFRQQQLDALDKAERDRLKALNDAHQNEINARKEFELQLRNEIFKTTATQDEYEIELLEQQYVKKKEEAKKNKADLLLVEEWYTNALSELLLTQSDRQYQIEQEKNKKLLDKKKEAHDKEQELATAYNDRRNAIDDELANAQLSAQDLELQQVRSHYLALIAEAEYFGRDSSILKEKQAKAELDITKKYAEQEAQLRVDTVAQGLSALTALNESFTARTEKTAKRQFNVNKALNMAMSLIDTYSAIVKALNSPETVPTSVKIAQAVAVGVMGFANVAKIAKTQFGGTSPDTSMNQGGNADSTTQANAPAIDFSGGQFNPNGPGTVETYVLAGNVANALEARQKIIDQSYL